MPDRADKTVTIPGDLRDAVTDALRVASQWWLDRSTRNEGDTAGPLFQTAMLLRALAEEIGGDE